MRGERDLYQTDQKADNGKDDGRTIADMSDVPGSVFGGWAPHRAGGQKRRDMAEPAEKKESRPWEDAPLSGRERRMYILGTLKATLLIGAVYLVALAALIGLLFLVWK